VIFSSRVIKYAMNRKLTHLFAIGIVLPIPAITDELHVKLDAIVQKKKGVKTVECLIT